MDNSKAYKSNLEQLNRGSGEQLITPGTKLRTSKLRFFRSRIPIKFFSIFSRKATLIVTYPAMQLFLCCSLTSRKSKSIELSTCSSLRSSMAAATFFDCVDAWEKLVCPKFLCMSLSQLCCFLYILKEIALKFVGKAKRKRSKTVTGKWLEAKRSCCLMTIRTSGSIKIYNYANSTFRAQICSWLVLFLSIAKLFPLNNSGSLIAHPR